MDGSGSAPVNAVLVYDHELVEQFLAAAAARRVQLLSEIAELRGRIAQLEGALAGSQDGDGRLAGRVLEAQRQLDEERLQRRRTAPSAFSREYTRADARATDS